MFLQTANFERPRIDAVIPFHMPPDILAAHDPFRIDTINDLLEPREIRVERLDIFRTEIVLFGPVWPALVFLQNVGEAGMEFAVRHSEAVRSGERSAGYHRRKAASPKRDKSGKLQGEAPGLSSPERDQADPTRLFTLTGAQPDIVRARPPDLDGKMHSQAIRAGGFAIQPLFDFGEARLGGFGRDSPFESVLGELPSSETASKSHQSF